MTSRTRMPRSVPPFGASAASPAPLGQLPRGRRTGLHPRFQTPTAPGTAAVRQLATRYLAAEPPAVAPAQRAVLARHPRPFLLLAAILSRRREQPGRPAPPHSAPVSPEVSGSPDRL